MSSIETSDTRQRRRPARNARVSGELHQRPFGRVHQALQAHRGAERRPCGGPARDRAEGAARHRHAGAGRQCAGAVPRRRCEDRRRQWCASIRRWWRSICRRCRRPSRWRRATARARSTSAADDVVFASVGGPAYVMDNDRGRRDGTYAEMCDYLQGDPVARHHPPGRRRPLRADGPSRQHPPPRPLPRADHAFWTRAGRPRRWAARAPWTG